MFSLLNVPQFFGPMIHLPTLCLDTETKKRELLSRSMMGHFENEIDYRHLSHRKLSASAYRNPMSLSSFNRAIFA